MGCHLISWGLAGRGGGVLYRMCTEMPSTAHAQWWLSTPLAREYVCQWCGKALPPLGIEPLPPAPKARALKDRAIWTLVVSHRYRREVHIHDDHCSHWAWLLVSIAKPPHVHCPAWQLWQRRGTRPEEEVSQVQEAWKEASVESEQLSALAASS